MLAPALGLESEHRILQFRAEITQEAAKSLHFNALDLVTDGGEIQNCALCGQTHGTSEHDSCVPCAYIDAELAQVILMWTLLSTNEKAQILAHVREQLAAAGGFSPGAVVRSACAGSPRPLPSPPMKQYHEPIQVEVGDDGLPCIVTVEATPRLASGDHPRG